MFLCITLLFQKTLAGLLNVDKEYVNYAIWILAFDALVIIPFSKRILPMVQKDYTILYVHITIGYCTIYSLACYKKFSKNMRNLANLTAFIV